MSTLNLPIQKVLELIKDNRQFRTSIIEKDDNILESIYKYNENPNCGSCVAALELFVNQNIDFINTLIRDLKAPTTVSEKVAETHVETPRAKQQLAVTPLKVAGEVYEIDADPNQFKELIETSQNQRWIFRGLNVLEKINSDGKKVWMIFFY